LLTLVHRALRSECRASSCPCPGVEMQAPLPGPWSLRASSSRQSAGNKQSKRKVGNYFRRSRHEFFFTIEFFFVKLLPTSRRPGMGGQDHRCTIPYPAKVGTLGALLVFRRTHARERHTPIGVGPSCVEYDGVPLQLLRRLQIVRQAPSNIMCSHTHPEARARLPDSSMTCVARYDLPLGVCYSPPLLFPGDPQWGAGDVLDQCDAAAGILTRTLYSSRGTCRGGGSPVQAPHTPHARHTSYTPHTHLIHTSYTPHTHERALRRKPAQTSLPRTGNEDRLSP